MLSRQGLTGSNILAVKSHNLSAILLTLLLRQPISRVVLAERTGLSTTTITNLINELLGQGIVIEDGTDEREGHRGAGRRRTALRLVPGARHVAAVHIDVGVVRIALSDLHASLQRTYSLSHPLTASPDEVLSASARLLEQALAERAGAGEVLGIGVGASGLVDPVRGVNRLAPNLGWRDVQIRDFFRARFGLPVCVDNNVRAMALGEALFGAGRDARVLAFVYDRIGVGAGLVVDGHVFRGSGAGAGEIGHVTILPDGGERCGCGNSGCLETLVSEPAIVRLAERLAAAQPGGILAQHLAHGQGSPIERVFAAARAGDGAVQALLEARGRFMGIALASLVNIFNPELILLGGILAQGSDLLLPAIESTVRQRAFADLGRKVRLGASPLGDQAGLVGAAALALDAFFYRQAEYAEL